ncbi:phosphoglycerate dehydrogenase [Vibrio sp. AK197]
MKVLVTCPPMLGMIDEFFEPAKKLGIELIPAETTQVLSVDELVALVPKYEGWIIGDDPATREVFEAGKSGKLKAAVKWGIGTDNVDFSACKDLNIPITNTPNMFGGEVADVAMSFLLGLARQTHYIDREIRNNHTWPKPAGISVSGKCVGVVGFGDIGENLVKRLKGFDVDVVVYDPSVDGKKGYSFIERANYPDRVQELDFIVFTCSLNKNNYHMLDENVLGMMKNGSIVINVARGPLIDEAALINALESEKIYAAGLDVFESEPLCKSSRLRKFPRCIFGTHNGSNTKEGVRRATHKALAEIAGYLNC